jgi:hypothetical protein
VLGAAEEVLGLGAHEAELGAKTTRGRIACVVVVYTTS